MSTSCFKHGVVIMSSVFNVNPFMEGNSDSFNWSYSGDRVEHRTDN